MLSPAARPSAPRAEVTVDRDILGGQPVISGTRIPAATILACLRDGVPAAEIRRDYPSLPADGIRAVERWAAREFGADWKSANPSAA